MSDFKTYYLNNFQKDLFKFFESIPDESKFHEDRERKQLFSIQHSRLTPARNHLDFLTIEENSLFGVALFYTVLADMVCYTHFKSHYSTFQALTRYPKFIGDCPGACHLHFHPRNIFSAMNYGLDRSDKSWINFGVDLTKSKPFIENEIHSFFTKHMNQISSEDFWTRFRSEFAYFI